MRLLVIGDLHGKKPVVSFDDIDAYLMVGDLSSDDDIRPFVSKAHELFLEGDDVSWVDLCSVKKANKLVEESAMRAREILSFMDSLGKPVFVVPGNWDWTGDGRFKDYWSESFEGLENCFDINAGLVSLEGVEVVGYGNCNGPELLSLRGYDLSEDELLDNVAEYQELKDYYLNLLKLASQPTIFLSHNVVYNTPLDVVKGKHLGSVLARDLVDEKLLLAAVGGHIHENFGSCIVNDTLCVNAGFGPDNNVLLELSGDALTATFYPGDKAKFW